MPLQYWSHRQTHAAQPPMYCEHYMTGPCVGARELLVHCSQKTAQTRHAGVPMPQKRSWGWYLVTDQTLQQTKV